MKLPDSFINTVRAVWGSAGKEWLATLDTRIATLSDRWQLSDLQLAPDLSYNVILFAHSDLYGPSVLKLSIPSIHQQREYAALKIYNKQGAVGLYAYDLDEGALLLERLLPGRSLIDLFPSQDEEATHIACLLIQELAQTNNTQTEQFLTMKQWFDPLFSTSFSQIPQEYYLQARKWVSELLEMNGASTLAHGDLHHTNIIESHRGWVSIDPKGVYAPFGFDVGCFMRNPGSLLDQPHYKTITGRRFEQFGHELSLERAYLVKMSYCQAVLSAVWALEDKHGAWKWSLACAALYMQY